MDVQVNLFKTVAGAVGDKVGSSDSVASAASSATSSSSSGPFSNLVTGVQNGAKIGSDVKSCYNSVEGKGSQISSAYDSASSYFADPSSLGSGGSAAQMLFGAYMASSEGATMMWKLYQIYRNKESSADTANAAQKAAYEQLTPECSTAFEEIDAAYGKAQNGAATFLTSTDKANNTCYAYAQTADEGYQVRFSLCVAPVATVPLGKGLAHELKANFTNFATPLCNLTFYVKDLDTAVNATPSWLPDADTKYPNGFPTDFTQAFRVIEPVDTTVDSTTTLFDIRKGWFACPNGRNTPAPTPARTSRPTTGTVSAADTILKGAASCFVTNKCKSAIAPFSGDDCSAYNALFTSTCHSCDADTVKSAKEACLVGCSAQQCAVTPTAATQSSGAGSLRLSFVALATGLAAAFAAYFM